MEASDNAINVDSLNQYPATWKACVAPDFTITGQEGKSHPTDFVGLDNEKFASAHSDGLVFIWNRLGILDELKGLPSKGALLLCIGSDFLAARSDTNFNDFYVYQLSDRSWKKLNGHKQPLSSWASLGQDTLATGDNGGVIKIWDLKSKKFTTNLVLNHTENIQQLISLDDRWLIRLHGEKRGDQKIGIWNQQNNNDNVISIDDAICVSKLLPLKGSKFVSYGFKYKEWLGGFIAAPEKGACIIWDSLGTKLYQWEADGFFKDNIIQLKSEDLAVVSGTSIEVWTLSGVSRKPTTSFLKTVTHSRGVSRANLVATSDGGVVYCHAQGDRFDQQSVNKGCNQFHASLKVLYHSGHVIEIMHTLIEPTFIISLEQGGFAAFYGNTICAWQDPPTIRLIRDLKSSA